MAEDQHTHRRAGCSERDQAVLPGMCSEER